MAPEREDMKPPRFSYHDPNTVGEVTELIARLKTRGCWPAGSR